MDADTYQWATLCFAMPIAAVATASAIAAIRAGAWLIVLGCLGYFAFGTEPMGYIDFAARRWLPPLLLCVGILRVTHD